MEFIAGLWWLWLIVTLGALSYGIYNFFQCTSVVEDTVLDSATTVATTRNIGEAGKSVVAGGKGFFTGIGKIVAAIIVASFSGILLVIAVMVHVADYIKG